MIGAALGLVDPPALPAPAIPAITAVPVDAPGPVAPVDRATDPGLVIPLPYRVETDAMVLLDLQRYPSELIEVRCSTAPEVAAAMLARQVIGAPVLAEVTGYGIWLATIGTAGMQPTARRNRVRAMGAAFRSARTGVATVGWAVDRMVAALDEAVAAKADDVILAAAMRAAADAIASDMARDLHSLCAAGAAALPDARGEVLEIITHDPTGRLSGGGIGTAIGIIAAAAAQGRPVHVWLVETHPGIAANRLAALELAAAGVPTSIVGAAGVSWLLASKRIDLALVGADRISLDGSVTAAIGTYGIAALAAHHRVPVWVASPTAAIERDAQRSRTVIVDAEPYATVDVARLGSNASGPRARSRGPLQDVTPAGLVDRIVTEAGILRPPYDASVAAAAGVAAIADGD